MALPARIRRPRMPAATIALAALLLCAACSKPAPPETDRPPEPQADAAQATIRQPIDRARAVQGEVDAGATKQRAGVDAQTGY
jgi:hypothetical protein